MIRTYRIQRVPGDELVVRLPEPSGGPAIPGRLLVSHGARRLEVAVKPTVEEPSVIQVTGPAVDALRLLPDAIPYQIRWRRGELRFGPVVGILAGLDSDRLDPAPGSYLRNFLLRYPQVGGLVYLFGARNIDFDREVISGWCWVPGDGAGNEVGGVHPEWERARKLANLTIQRADADAEPENPHPRTARFAGMAREFLSSTSAEPLTERWSGTVELGSGRFIAGTFPFPAAIWRRAGFLGQKEMGRLAARLGPHIFNSSFFDKAEGHRILSADPVIRDFLPATRPFVRLLDLYEQLEATGAAILKRREGNSGYGMIRVDYDPDREEYRFRVREKPGLTEHLRSREELHNRITPCVTAGQYLLQECIHLPEYKGRPNDYRVFLQKDETGRWGARAVIGRFGAHGSIVTSFVNNGYALPGAEALCRAFGVGYRTAHTMEADIVDLAIAVGEALDRSGGCYGDLGLDIALDRARRLWLFEVNKLPFLELPLYAGDEQAYLEVKSGPLSYAAFLAGFGDS